MFKRKPTVRDDDHDGASPLASYGRREVLLAAPAVAAVGMGLVYPAAALAGQGNGCLARERVVEEHLETFRYLDFHVFNDQQWDKVHRSHSRDVVVHWPDGRVTVGIDAHIEDLKGLFVWAPDTQVLRHTMLFGGGDAAQFTGCIGTLAGTFTRPLPIGGGNSIPPTGKRFEIQFSTTCHWIPGGVFDEEYLLWDNQELNRQLGLS